MKDNIIYKLLINDLSLLEGLILTSLKDNTSSYITLYIKDHKLLPIDLFINLQNNGWITIQGELKAITLDRLSLTDKANKTLFGNNFTSKDQLDIFNECFNELRKSYVVKTPGGRRLQVELDNCKKLYKDIIIKNNIVDVEEHNKIIKCIKKEIYERSNTMKIEYMVQLPRYIRHKMWETYEDELDIIKEDFSEDI